MFYSRGCVCVCVCRTILRVDASFSPKKSSKTRKVLKGSKGWLRGDMVVFLRESGWATRTL